jgi:hypothetical protein
MGLLFHSPSRYPLPLSGAADVVKQKKIMCLSIGTNTAMNLGKVRCAGACVLSATTSSHPDFYSFTTPEMELLGHMVVLLLSFWGTSISPTVCKFPISSLTGHLCVCVCVCVCECVCVSVCNSLPHRNEVIFYCAFDLHFSDEFERLSTFSHNF